MRRRHPEAVITVVQAEHAMATAAGMVDAIAALLGQPPS